MKILGRRLYYIRKRMFPAIGKDLFLVSVVVIDIIYEVVSNCAEIAVKPGHDFLHAVRFFQFENREFGAEHVPEIELFGARRGCRQEKDAA